MSGVRSVLRKMENVKTKCFIIYVFVEMQIDCFPFGLLVFSFHQFHTQLHTYVQNGLPGRGVCSENYSNNVPYLSSIWLYAAGESYGRIMFLDIECSCGFFTEDYSVWVAASLKNGPPATERLQRSRKRDFRFMGITLLHFMEINKTLWSYFIHLFVSDRHTYALDIHRHGAIKL